MRIVSLIPCPLQLMGQRISLRTPAVSDAPSFQKILSDPTTMNHLKYMAYSPHGWLLDQVKIRLENQIRAQKEQRGLHFAVVSHDTHHVVGNCGFNSINLEHRNGNFGLILHHTVWGTGVAQECHLLCLSYGFEVLGLHRIEFGTFKENIRMRKFLENVGISLEGVQKETFFEDGRYKDDYIYALFDTDWPRVKERLERSRAKAGGGGRSRTAE